MYLSKMIRQLRTAQKKTLRGLAAEAGVTLSTLQLIESGAGNPTVDVLGKVLDKLGHRLAVEPGKAPKQRKTPGK